MRIEHVMDDRDSVATIRIEGLEKSLRVLHVTDCHLAEGDGRDPEAAEYVTRFRQLFQERTPGGVPAREVFARVLGQAARQGIDAALLTGDIIHFPAWAGIEAIRQELDGLAAPYLYALGNHDWHLPSRPWCEATRAAFYPRFGDLTGGDPACQSLQVGGVRFIALDNSNYQVSEAQVAFLRREIACGQPCILCFHIPLWIESLTAAVVDLWKAPIMMGVEEGWTEQTKTRWQVADATESTRQCRELLMSGASQNVAAIFCGHVHFDHIDQYRAGRFQYVTRPGFAGGHRTIDLRPA